MKLNDVELKIDATKIDEILIAEKEHLIKSDKKSSIFDYEIAIIIMHVLGITFMFMLLFGIFVSMTSIDPVALIVVLGIICSVLVITSVFTYIKEAEKKCKEYKDKINELDKILNIHDLIDKLHNIINSDYTFSGLNLECLYVAYSLLNGYEVSLKYDEEDSESLIIDGDAGKWKNSPVPIVLNSMIIWKNYTL